MHRSIRTRGRGERMGRVLSREIKDKLADWPTFSNLLPTITKRFDDECPIRSFDSLFREIVQVPYIIEYSLIFAMIARNESRSKKFGNYLGERSQVRAKNRERRSWREGSKRAFYFG